MLSEHVYCLSVRGKVEVWPSNSELFGMRVIYSVSEEEFLCLDGGQFEDDLVDSTLHVH